MRWTVRLSYNPHDPYEAKYDEEAFLVDAKEAAQSCKEIAARVESVESALSKRDEEKVIIIESDLPESVPSDPGLRPPNTTKSQIKCLSADQSLTTQAF